MWKVYQKWNLFRYCSKSLPYFPIWPLKVIQGQRSSSSKIMRSTERPYTCIWLPICVSSKFLSWHAPFRRYSPFKTQLYLLWPLKVKVKGNEVNWNTIYDLLYVFHINFGHDKHKLKDHIWLTICVETCVITCIIQKIQPIKNSITLIWPLNVIQGQRSWGQLRDDIWLTICVSYKLWS